MPFHTEQETQFEQFKSDVLRLTEKVGTLTAKNHADVQGAAKQISRLRDDLSAHMADFHKRAQAWLNGDAQPAASHGFRLSPQHAKSLGELTIALMRYRGSGDSAGLHTAAVSGSSGESGGYLLIEQIASGILRLVEQYGVLERNARILPMKAQKSSFAKRTGGLTVYHPDLGAAATPSQSNFARVALDLSRYVVYTLVDNNMLRDQTVEDIGQFVAEEIAHTVALATDTYGFVGDGTSTYNRVTGIFKVAAADPGASGLNVVGGDATDTTFQKLIDKGPYYLAKCLGGLPNWVEAIGAVKWFMHRTIFSALWA